MQPVRGCIHFARVIRPSSAMLERGSETLVPRLLHFRDELSSSSTTRNSGRTNFPTNFRGNVQFPKGFSPVKAAVVPRRFMPGTRL